MNILFINSRDASSYGGGEKWIINAGKGLHKLGHRVTIAGMKGSLLLTFAHENQLETFEIHIPRDVSPITTWKLKKYFDEKKFDVIILNTNRDVRVAGIAAKLSGIKNVYARHGAHIISNKTKYTLPLKLLTKGIITNTQGFKNEYEEYKKFPPDFVNVVHNGIENENNIAPYDFSKEYPGKKIILAAGRLIWHKGFSDLIDAASIICKKQTDIAFLIAGRGELEDVLQKKIIKLNLEKHVFLIGFYSSIYPLIKGADIFVLSSVSEGMPNVVMEAMMLGTPVVATRVNGVSELMMNNYSGIIVNPSAPEEIACGIEHLLSSKNSANKIVKNAYHKIKTDFSNEKMVQHLIQIFSK